MDNDETSVELNGQPTPAETAETTTTAEASRIGWSLLGGMFLGSCLFAWSQATYSACEDQRYPAFLNTQNCDTTLKWMIFVVVALVVSWLVSSLGMRWAEKNGTPRWKFAAAFPALVAASGLIWASQMYLF